MSHLDGRLINTGQSDMPFLPTWCKPGPQFGPVRGQVTASSLSRALGRFAASSADLLSTHAFTPVPAYGLRHHSRAAMVLTALRGPKDCALHTTQATSECQPPCRKRPTLVTAESAGQGRGEFGRAGQVTRRWASAMSHSAKATGATRRWKRRVRIGNMRYWQRLIACEDDARTTQVIDDVEPRRFPRTRVSCDERGTRSVCGVGEISGITGASRRGADSRSWTANKAVQPRHSSEEGVGPSMRPPATVRRVQHRAPRPTSARLFPVRTVDTGRRDTSDHAPGPAASPRAPS